MDKQRAPVKVKRFVAEDSKKGKPKKRWRDVMEKDVLVRGLKSTNAHNHSVWMLGCKNRIISACEEKQPGSRRMKKFVNNPGTNE